MVTFALYGRSQLCFYAQNESLPKQRYLQRYQKSMCYGQQSLACLQLIACHLFGVSCFISVGGFYSFSQQSNALIQVRSISRSDYKSLVRKGAAGYTDNAVPDASKLGHSQYKDALRRRMERQWRSDLEHEAVCVGAEMCDDCWC